MSDTGDLDLAERSYRRAIDDAEALGHVDDSMRSMYEMTIRVYTLWGRFDEAL